MPYHIGFSRADLGNNPPRTALLSGEPERSRHIANTYLENVKLLSQYRGLNSYLGNLPNGKPLLIATSGMGAPSTSIVVNELAQVGIQKIIRIGTCGSIQPLVKVGSVVISQAALCRQGAALDIAPVEYPAVADPFVTVALAEQAQQLNYECHVGITASVDTFYEGQVRTESSVNPHLQPWLVGTIENYRQLKILNYEMESGTLFKLGSVYGLKIGCICAVVAQRDQAEAILIEQKQTAVTRAIEIAISTVTNLA